GPRRAGSGSRGVTMERPVVVQRAAGEGLRVHRPRRQPARCVEVPHRSPGRGETRRCDRISLTRQEADMTREIIATDAAPHPDAPISQAVRVGQLVFVSGITPFTRDMRLAKGDFAAQMHQVMANLDAILNASGSSLSQVVKCTVILARREDWR